MGTEPEKPVSRLSHQTGAGADPKAAFCVLNEGAAVVILEFRGVEVIEHSELQAIKAGKAALSSHPQISVAGLEDRPNTIFRQAVLVLPGVPVELELDPLRLTRGFEVRRAYPGQRACHQPSGKTSGKTRNAQRLHRKR
jgi:hypothetical protein